MSIKLAIWDWNGTLQNDARHFYEAGARRIFAHFGLACPDFDTHRRECQHDWLSYYHAKGVPADVGPEALNAILHHGLADLGPAPIFDDALEIVEAFQDAHVINVLASGQVPHILTVEVGRHGFEFAAMIGGVKDKPAAFRERMVAASAQPNETIVIGDMVNDAEAALAVGCRVYICPRGFHAPEHVLAAQPRLPNMKVIATLAGLRYLLL